MSNNLMRVNLRIGALVKAFCTQGKVFHMEELTAHVVNAMAQMGEKVAPDSPGRILRDLKKTGQLNYRLISRRASLYEVLY